jgi:hypothetical protein
LSLSPAARFDAGARYAQYRATLITVDSHFTPSLSDVTIAFSAIPPKVEPVITWSNPAGITYGTALFATQLNAVASVPGTFAYTPAAGAVLPAGNGQQLRVDFTPDDTRNYTSASKNVLINVINTQIATSIATLTSSLNPSAYGTTVTLTATVTPAAATGGVQFFDGATLLGTASVAGGTASLATAAINAGTRTITAKYVPTGSYASSASTPLTQTVTPATGTTAVAVALFTVAYSDVQTFTATFTPSKTGGPAPTTISVRIGAQTIGEAPVIVSGGVYKAVWTGQLLEPVNPAPATAQIKPGAKTVYTDDERSELRRTDGQPILYADQGRRARDQLDAGSADECVGMAR